MRQSEGYRKGGNATEHNDHFGIIARKLTLVSAPPEFGKTTRLSEWIPQCPYRVTWVSPDQSDNDPTRYWAYVIAALQTLMNEVAAFSERSMLVLDDYHVIAAQPIHRAMTFLLDHMPAKLHLVLTSRSAPPLPLAL